MNYESLNCCSLVEIKIQFMKIYFFKTLQLTLFLCGVCFVFKYYTMSKCFDRWCDSLVNLWRNLI